MSLLLHWLYAARDPPQKAGENPHGPLSRAHWCGWRNDETGGGGENVLGAAFLSFKLYSWAGVLVRHNILTLAAMRTNHNMVSRPFGTQRGGLGTQWGLHTLDDEKGFLPPPNPSFSPFKIMVLLHQVTFNTSLALTNPAGCSGSGSYKAPTYLPQPINT